MNFELILFLIVFLIGLVIAYKVGSKIGELRKERFWKKEVMNQRRDAVNRSRAVLKGNFSEQLAPYLPGFNYSPTECKFLGKPVDFLVFRGSDEKKVDEIVFVEVKSGKGKLSPVERELKKAVEDGRVRWEEYRVD